MTEMSQSEAYEAARAHHVALLAGLNERVEHLRRAVSAAAGWEPQVGALVAYLADEVLPHAAAEERVLYPLAARSADLDAPVGELIAEHRSLEASAGDLTRVSTGVDALRAADEISIVFASHVARENDLVLPVLLADSEVDIAEALASMGDVLDDLARRPSRGAVAEEVEEALMSLVLATADELSRSGQAEWACRLAARAWGLVRAERPDLARQVTARLHVLSRRATTAPVHLTSAPGRGRDEELDVRSLAPAERHEAIFAAFAALAPGTSFVLVNDHDPKPLRYQFDAEHEGTFTWDYLVAGPREWRVRIGR